MTNIFCKSGGISITMRWNVAPLIQGLKIHKNSTRWHNGDGQKSSKVKRIKTALLFCCVALAQQSITKISTKRIENPIFYFRIPRLERHLYSYPYTGQIGGRQNKLYRQPKKTKKMKKFHNNDKCRLSPPDRKHCC